MAKYLRRLFTLSIPIVPPLLRSELGTADALRLIHDMIYVSAGQLYLHDVPFAVCPDSLSFISLFPEPLDGCICHLLRSHHRRPPPSVGGRPSPE